MIDDRSISQSGKSFQKPHPGTSCSISPAKGSGHHPDGLEKVFESHSPLPAVSDDGMINRIARRKGKFNIAYTDEVVQNVENLPYYHYRLHRDSVELLCPDNGDFIVRLGGESAGEENRVILSIRASGRIMHFPIYCKNNKVYFDSFSFELVQNLIYHYFSNKIPLTTKSETILKRARNRQNWEMHSSRVITGRKLGQGAYGFVYKAYFRRGCFCWVSVAVKKLNESPTIGANGELLQTSAAHELERKNMLYEAKSMHDLNGHPNIIRSYGVTVDTEAPWAIMEIMSGGSVNDRLKDTNHPLSPCTKLKVLIDAIRGLSYVHRCNYIHRDIAARNCLYKRIGCRGVGIVKLCDFGLARPLTAGKYSAAPEECEKLPFQVTAPEGLIDHEWTVFSDIWSFGVLIWQVFAGCEPFSDLMDKLDFENVLKRLGNNDMLQPTKDMPESVAEVIKNCMQFDENIRPSLMTIEQTLLEELGYLDRKMKRPLPKKMIEVSTKSSMEESSKKATEDTKSSKHSKRT